MFYCISTVKFDQHVKRILIIYDLYHTLYPAHKKPHIKFEKATENRVN